ncbi:toxin-activating lysine-acyltransferase [Tabrizicola sp.]|uniref:toxin-activating lysine-acyltransferase n=1 Tax=Tabrizicola sp. TaxID=2005166 RepID=UPI002633B514|nr:toxin-activating lysine-acyltransferase [Tabrizicola sp.]MDM7930623.1 toxin-activating lysine-acyltransferase [Tabrizicola sp.]
MTLTDSAGRTLPVVETPPPDTLRLYGDVLFLAMRSPRHAAVPIAQLRAAFEPPLALGQVRVFRFDDVPRGLFTWAWFSEDAERRYVTGEALAPGDWQSGDRHWLIDMISPYRGLTANLVRWIMTPGNFAEREFLFRRVAEGNRTRRIVRIHLDRPDDKAEVMTEAAFLKG